VTVRRVVGSLPAVVLVALAVLGGALLPPVCPAAGAARPVLRLVSQPVQLAEAADAAFRFQLDGSVPADATLVAIARQPVKTRGELREVIDKKRTTTQADRVEMPLASVPVVDGQLVLTLPTESTTSETARLRLRNAGLYPLSFEIRSGTETLATLNTFVERTGPDPATARVRTALMVRLDAAPTLQPNGSTLISDTTRSEIDRLLELLELNTAVPLTVALRPELLEGLSRSGFPADTDRLARLEAVFTARNEVLPTTYVHLDPNIAVDQGIGAEFADQLIRGEDTIQEQLGVVATGSLWALDGPIDGDALDLLRVVGVQSVLVGVSARADLPAHDGALASVRTTNGASLEALSTDLVVQTRLTTPNADPVLAAYDIVSDLSAMTLQAEQDAAELDEPRALGLLIDLGSLDDVDPTMLSTLLAVLPTTTRLAPMAASDAITDLIRHTPASKLDRLGIEVDQGALDTSRAETLAHLRSAVTSTSSMLPGTDQRPDRWRALTLVYPATNLTDDAREEYVDQLEGEMGVVRGEVTVEAPDRVSLGGRHSKVPVTLVNSGSTPRSVRVRLSSPKLELAQPDTVVEIVDRETFEIDVEAKTNGVFPVTVELLTPEGDRAAIGPKVTFTVQATALTGLGQFISGALVLVLATWWIQHWRARRRANAALLVAGIAAHPAAPSEAG
jgi:hypothetical protein